MKILIITLLLSSTYAFSFDRFIKVSGECELETTFDMYGVSITLNNEDMNQAKINDLLKKRNNDLLLKMKNLKLANYQVKTREYGISEVRVWENNKQVFKGYKGSVILDVELKTQESLTKLYKLLSSEKLDRVDGPHQFLSPEKNQELENKCIEVALKHAKQKATLMAKTLGAELSKVISIKENDQPVIKNYGATNEMMMMKATAAPEIETGKNKFRKTLFVEFELR